MRLSAKGYLERQLMHKQIISMDLPARASEFGEAPRPPRPPFLQGR